MEITVLKDQSLFDIAIQTAGSVEAVMEIAAVNDISITDNLKEGTVLQIPAVMNTAIADYFRSNGLFPKTGLSEEDRQILPGGIGYMGIEIDFIVS